MKKAILLVLVFAFITGPIPGVAKAKLVACVGSSTTYGYGLPDRTSNCYPAQLTRILQGYDSEWESRNFGVNGTCVLRKGSMPYITQSTFNNALACEPDVVVIQLGVNDSIGTNWQYKDDFIPDFLALIDAFAQLPSNPKIYIWYPKPVFSSPWGHDNMVIRDEIIPLISQLPTYREVQVIDLYTPFKDSPHLFQTDGVHLNTEGTIMAAEIVATAILGMRWFPDFNGDSKVNIEDLVILIEHWGQSEPALDVAPPPFGDGIIDVQDLEVVMQYWGQEVNDPTLVAHWALDEAEGVFAYDSAGWNDAFAIGENVWQPEAGMVNGAIMLDGVDDCVITNPIPNFTAGPFSAIGWIKGGVPGQVILSQMGVTNWLCTDISDGTLMTELKSAGQDGISLGSETIITDDDWHRIGIVWDGLYRRLYVNGVMVAEDTQDGLEGSESGLYIGTDKMMQPGTYFSGLIDDVRIYNRVVSP